MGNPTTALIRELDAQGFDVQVSKKHHYAVRTPSGKFVTTFAATPSDHRSQANCLAAVRRHGFSAPKKPHKRKCR